ncbi:D-hexose-6-phosphate mutarotase [Metapseudomonas boanensis]|uniref:Putative glucose-6-phosphate 1-epimerase n=1 Tax=Metapseudomonas boanensis TaxID=2822138 RepID=A0ABS5XKY9_9GAMM|nr:D-hexose-6-phosphate mutarotase [Pseudomonas boanensis]MBT8766952.1 D-hexose-6-phosphate mutarotase [Pseudomonas boanensis]
MGVSEPRHARPHRVKTGEGVDHPLADLLRPEAGQSFRWTEQQGRELLLVEHPRCTAVFSRQGGQLLHFQPRGERPLLWCAARWPRIGAIRGGVPVCWPWFGRHPMESGWPHHGWARLSDWRLTGKEADATGVRLNWRLELHDWVVELEAELGDEMHLRLTTRHRDSETCVLSHALHAYWRISDVARVGLLGLDGAEGRDLLVREACRQEGELRIVDGCHRVFRRGGKVTIQDAGWQRRICIDGGGNANTVVWHPGSRPLGEVSWSEGLGFLSVQGAACGQDGVTLVAGEEARLSLRVWVE